MTFEIQGNGYGADELAKLSKSAQRGIAAFDKDSDGSIKGKEIEKLNQELLTRLSRKDGNGEKISKKESRALARELREQGYDVSARDLRNAYKGIVGLSIERGDAFKLEDTGITASVTEEKTSRPKSKVFTNPQTGEQTIHEFTYDDLGRKLQTKVSTGETIDYVYEGDSQNPAAQIAKDKDGNQIEKREFAYDANGNLVSTTVYDENGLAQTIAPADDGLDSTELASANVVREQSTNYETGEQLASRTFNYDNNRSVKHNYSYDAQGRKALVRTSTGEKISYAYLGKNTQPSEQTTRDENNNLISRELYAYDANGNKTKTEFYNANNELEATMSFEYSADGREIRREYRTGESITVDETTYLAGGTKTVTSTTTDADNNVNTFVAYYDSTGNEIDKPEEKYFAQN